MNYIKFSLKNKQVRLVLNEAMVTFLHEFVPVSSELHLDSDNVYAIAKDVKSLHDEIKDYYKTKTPKALNITHLPKVFALDVTLNVSLDYGVNHSIGVSPVTFSSIAHTMIDTLNKLDTKKHPKLIKLDKTLQLNKYHKIIAQMKQDSLSKDLKFSQKASRASHKMSNYFRK